MYRAANDEPHYLLYLHYSFPIDDVQDRISDWVEETILASLASDDEPPAVILSQAG